MERHLLLSLPGNLCNLEVPRASRRQAARLSSEWHYARLKSQARPRKIDPASCYQLKKSSPAPFRVFSLASYSLLPSRLLTANELSWLERGSFS